MALLREAVATVSSSEALACEMERIYDQVGCPEDMLGLWTHARGQQHPPAAHQEALQAFLHRLAPSILTLAS